MSIKCLIADSFESEGVEKLRALGIELRHEPALNEAGLAAALASFNPDVLIVRGKKVNAEAIGAGSALSLIVRAGAGFNTIDVAAASGRGIYVANCPGKNAAAVADLVFGLILALDRQIPDNVADLRAGKWNKKLYSEARGLKGRTLGIIGMGGIGKEVVQRARGFDMPVVAWSRSLTPAQAEELGVAFASSPADVASRSDVLSVHVALASDTRGFINADVLGRLKPGSYFINTSRGEVVDYRALREAIAARKIRVGLDVFEKEPAGGTGAFEDDIVKLPGVYGTHHIGASTEQAQLAIADETVRIVECFLRTGAVPNTVNLCGRSPAKRLLVVRHHNRPGVLAHILSEISHAGINVEEMENVIFSDAKAACAKIRLDDEPSAAVLARVREGCKDVLAVSLLAIEG